MPWIEVAPRVGDPPKGVSTFFPHRIPDAVAEGRNSKIATIQKMAVGFRHQDHYRTAIEFRWGGPPPHPATHPIPGWPEKI